MRYLSILFIVLSLLGLAACTSAKDSRNHWTVSDYLSQPEILRADIKTCAANNDSDNALNCQTVQAAANEIQKLLMMAIQNGEAFGETILQQEMAVADIQAQLAELRNKPVSAENIMAQKNLEQKLYQEQLLIQQYLGIIRLLGI